MKLLKLVETIVLSVVGVILVWHVLSSLERIENKTRAVCVCNCITDNR